MEIQNNELVLIGTLKETVSFSHKVFGENFLMIFVESERLSGNVDCLPVIVSERLVDLSDYMGKKVKITGRFASYNKTGADGKRHLRLNVFANTIELVDKKLRDQNKIILDGYVCKPVIYRTTPLGRKVSDIFLAVNRMYNKSDYIPCIAWGRQAIHTADFAVGTRMRIEGRIQSRQYLKNEEQKVAYEVSIAKLEKIVE